MNGLVIKQGLLSLTFFRPSTMGRLELPMFASNVKMNSDFGGIEQKIDLNHFLIHHPSATFYVRVKGNAMVDSGIADGDMLIVDRAIEPQNNSIAVCVINGEFKIKRLKKEKKMIYMVQENPEYPPMLITESKDFQIWGVVTYVIHKV